MRRTTAPNSVSGRYVDDNPDELVNGTLLIAVDRNAIQEEIANAIVGAGLTLAADENQLLTALRATGNTFNAENLHGRAYDRFFAGDNSRGSVSITDANSPLMSGSYQLSTPFTNGPTAAEYLIDHVQRAAGDTYAFQIASRVSSGETFSGQYLYFRKKVNGSWLSWQQIFTEGNGGLLVPRGVPLPFAGGSVPDGFLLCNGAAVSRTTYAALFAALNDGADWGTGNGSTTFNVPDFREASLAGVGTFSLVSGSTHGAITTHDAVTLGQFKDDQMQQITGYFRNTGLRSGYNTVYGAFTQMSYGSDGFLGGSSSGIRLDFDSANSPGARAGTVTRGKIIGVNFIIKY